MRRNGALLGTLAVLFLGTPSAEAGPRCSNPNGPAAPTLAYALGECEQDSQGGFSGRQRLVVRRGDCDPVAVVEISRPGPVPDPLGLCRLYGKTLNGTYSLLVGGFQWIRVTPDGAGVVFELTNRFRIFPQFEPELPEEGIFFVGSDGTGLKRLGPPLRIQGFSTSSTSPTPENPLGLNINLAGFSTAMSPRGRTVAFVDLGPGPEGQEAPQIWILDIASGERRPLTSFRPPGPVPAFSDGVCCLSYPNEHTVAFLSGPISKYVAGRVGTNGRRLRYKDLVPVGAGAVMPQFSVVRGPLNAELVQLSPPSPDGTGEVTEIYLARGRHVLQLTKFGRPDTAQPILTRGRVLFVAGADPFGENPLHMGQLFSVGFFASGLRQLTHLGTKERLCRVRPGTVMVDSTGRDIIFNSVCDPFGTNPFGEQLFGIRRDGSGLRQLTALRGYAIDADGTAHAELIIDADVSGGGLESYR